MADPQISAEQIQKLEKQQKKFNDELIRTQLLTDQIFADNKGIAGELKDSIDRANKLNVEFATGQDISKQVSKERLKSAVEIQKIDNAIAVKQAVLAKTKNIDASKTLALEIQSLKTQRDITEQIDAQLRGMESFIEEEKRALELEKERNTTSGFIKEKYKDLAKSFKEFFSIASIFKAIVDAALRLNKISVDIGKNLGYGADNANRVASNLVEVAQSSTNLNITLANAGEAMAQISESTGYVAEYSADALETQIMLTKQFGLTADEAAGVYRLSVLTGKSSKAVNDAMVGAFAATKNQLKAGIPFKATIAEAAKVSGQLAANLQNNPALITKAIVTAKAFGFTLEQVAKSGESLLDFESSLENELKAELLTGKQLNLERARAAALAGDQVALTEELVKNVGTLDDFQKMNVLQQKSLAQAFGLTADELANQLRNQKIALESGKSLAEVNADELTQAQERQNIQDKFNQAILKLQDTIGNLVAGPFGALIDMLSYALNIVGLIGKPFVFLSNLIDRITGKTSGLASVLKGVLAIVAGIALFMNPVGALAALAISGAMIAGVESFSGQKFAAGGIVTSEINNATVGEAGPEAIIPLNSPKANDILGINKEISGGSIDLTPMILAINEVKAAVNQLMNRPVIINMDSKQVGSSLVQTSPKSA